MTLWEQIVGVGKPYLGPATETFLSRQCKSHLKIEGTAVTKAHLPDLAKWVENSGGLIMDPPKAAEMARKIVAL